MSHSIRREQFGACSQVECEAPVWNMFCLCDLNTDHISTRCNAVASVRSIVNMPLQLLNRVIFDLDLLCVYGVMTTTLGVESQKSRLGYGLGSKGSRWNLDPQLRTVFSARCNLYISRLCYDVNVHLSVRLSVTEVHGHIIANLGFKFWSQFTADCGRGACVCKGRDHRREEWRDHLTLC